MTHAKGLTAKAQIDIEAPATRVWQALTDPEMISEYLFGTQVTTDWRPGSPITYRGTWNGTAYEDKGIIEEVVPEKLLRSTYWSSMSGTEDSPENYAVVTYELDASGGKTTLTLTQDNCLTPESRAHSESNWAQVLVQLKKLVEKK